MHFPGQQQNIKHLIRILIVASILITPSVALVSMPNSVYAANLALNPSDGTPGSTITVSGSDFTGKLATIYWDDRIISERVSIEENGTFSHEIDIPNASKGTHTIHVTDDSNWAANDVTANFTVTPIIFCQPTVAREWTDITINGKGFQSEEHDITITIDGQELLLSPISADRDGTWTAQYTVPAEYAGIHTLSAFGSTTSADEIEGLDLIVSPWATLHPLSGPVGSQMIIEAWGFRHNEDGISLAWDGETFFMNIRAESDGSILCDGSVYPDGDVTHDGKYRPVILVPESTAGKHILVLYGSSFTPKGTFTDFEFEVIPRLEGNPAKGKVGTRIQINGTGFSAGESITLKWDDDILDTNLSANNKGSFDTIIVVSQSSISSHTITATGDQGHSDQIDFVLEGITNVQLSLLSPANGSSYTLFNSVGSVIISSFKYFTGIFAYLDGDPVDYPRSPDITFQWEGGGLQDSTYILQIASDSKFSHPLMEKEIHNNDSYTLKPDEMLSEGIYHWRVKSIDSRDIESPWSSISQIEIVSMPVRVSILTWITVILVLAAIICGLLFLWYYLKR